MVIFSEKFWFSHQTSNFCCPHPMMDGTKICHCPSMIYPSVCPSNFVCLLCNTTLMVLAEWNFAHISISILNCTPPYFGLFWYFPHNQSYSIVFQQQNTFSTRPGTILFRSDELLLNNWSWLRGHFCYNGRWLFFQSLSVPFVLTNEKVGSIDLISNDWLGKLDTPSLPQWIDLLIAMVTCSLVH